jgi:DNA processing protein
MYILRESDRAYPDLLRFIKYPPKQLYAVGNLLRLINEQRKQVFAVVGSRRATEYGLDMAFSIARDLSEAGLVIVSGLAEGIDAAAHKGALEGGGGTIAVLGCGVDVYYPRINRRLHDRIAETGSVISELPLKTMPRGDQFPSRNRIISGLSMGVLVVEGAAKSGTLITADMALTQGRDVFALPGHVTNRNSKTPNTLLKAGACLVESARDILDELNMSMNQNNYDRQTGDGDANEQDISQDEKKILSAVSVTPKRLEKIIYETGLQCENVSSILMVLEIRNLVARTLDGEYTLASGSARRQFKYG